MKRALVFCLFLLLGGCEGETFEGPYGTYLRGYEKYLNQPKSYEKYLTPEQPKQQPQEKSFEKYLTPEEPGRGGFTISPEGKVTYEEEQPLKKPEGYRKMPSGVIQPVGGVHKYAAGLNIVPRTDIVENNK